MNRCPSCGVVTDGIVAACPACAFEPVRIDGFAAFAPVLAREASGFDPSHFAPLAELEAGNFWFRSRNALIRYASKRFAPDARRYLEIGCGTGFVLSMLAAEFPALECWGSEVYVDGLEFARQRVPGSTLFQMDARAIPFAGYFDVIGIFDVLEHIEEDELVLDQMHGALATGGHALITVPQHSWLWSVQDEYAHHVRRYERGELEGKLAAHGFKVRFSTSFVSLLLPALMLSRLRHRDATAEADPFAEFRIPRWLDWAMLQAMSIERLLIRAGARFPAGGSRLIVAEKLG